MVETLSLDPASHGSDDGREQEGLELSQTTPQLKSELPRLKGQAQAPHAMIGTDLKKQIQKGRVAMKMLVDIDMIKW